MLVLPLIASLLLAPPASEPASSSDEPAEGSATASDEASSEFGPLEANPESQGGPTPDASGGYGAVTPLPNYDNDPAGPPPVVEAPAPTKKKKNGFQEPDDYGPFFEPEPVSEIEHPGDAVRPDRKQPFASVAGGTFCFVEDSVCTVSLLLDADVGVGLNVITSGRGLDVPYTQFRVRWGATLRPVKLAAKRWHPWAVGLVGSWSLGSGAITATSQDSSDPFAGVTETDPIRTWRVAMVNQLWLSQRRNALHLDFSIGGANSSVLDLEGRYWGTHAELALGFGGWAAAFLSGDFLDQDTRVVLGFRGHGIATAPLIGLVLLGLVAGGVAL